MYKLLEVTWQEKKKTNLHCLFLTTPEFNKYAAMLLCKTHQECQNEQWL